MTLRLRYDLIAEYARTRKSSCRKCGQRIEEDQLRIGQMLQAQKYDKKEVKWNHFSCFFKYDAPKDVIDIQNFATLRYEDQEKIRKIYMDKKKQVDCEIDDKHESDLRNQLELLYKDYQKIKAMKKEIKKLLSVNGIIIDDQVPSNYNIIADFLTFGLIKCPQCKTGPLVFQICGYVCYGSEELKGTYIRCNYETRSYPEREKLKVPTELSKKHELLKEYSEKTYIKIDRIYDERLKTAIEKRCTQPNKFKKRKLSAEQELENVTIGNKEKEMILKDGISIDADSELSKNSTVVKDETKIGDLVIETIWSAYLIKVCLSTDTNSFYKLQVLKDDKSFKYHLLRAWGRIGEKIQGSKIEEFEKFKATQKFKEIFFAKTQYEWDQRDIFKELDYKAKRGAYVLVGVDNSLPYLKNITNTSNEESVSNLSETIPKPVKELIDMIFDRQNITNTIIKYKLDSEKMPLGKLSDYTLEKGESVVRELSDLLAEKGPNKRKIEAESKKFFQLIPHMFERGESQLIDSDEIISRKLEMLESMKNMKVTYSLIELDNQSLDLTNKHYKELRTQIEYVRSDEEDYKMIRKFIVNTNTDSNNITLDEFQILDIFRLTKEEEENKFEKFGTLKRMLLWHGTRVTNYVSILSQGLKIAPSEAQPTCSKYGKGIYFADKVSNSANYCHPEDNDKILVLLLCEVAVGTSLELNDEENMSHEKLKKKRTKYDSVKGIGETYPNPDANITLPCGLIVPCGQTLRHPEEKTYGHNEYVIYNPDQVKLRFLVRLKYKEENSPSIA